MDKYRRETKELIEKIRESKALTLQEIATQVGVPITSVSRWINLKASPHKKNFEKLKAIYEGRNNPGRQESQSPPGFSSLEGKLIDVLLTLPGRIDQLTKQIADLQAENGALKKDMMRSLLTNPQQEHFLEELDSRIKKLESSFFEKAGHRKQP